MMHMTNMVPVTCKHLHPATSFALPHAKYDKDRRDSRDGIYLKQAHWMI